MPNVCVAEGQALRARVDDPPEPRDQCFVQLARPEWLRVAHAIDDEPAEEAIVGPDAMIDTQRELIDVVDRGVGGDQILDVSTPGRRGHPVQQRDRNRVQSTRRNSVPEEWRTGAIGCSCDRIAKRRQAREVALADCAGRHRKRLRQRARDPLPFVVHEEECSVPTVVEGPETHGASGTHAKLLLTKGRDWLRRVVEVIAGVEPVVAEER